jgi:hypothetical protein
MIVELFDIGFHQEASMGAGALCQVSVAMLQAQQQPDS